MKTVYLFWQGLMLEDSAVLLKCYNDGLPVDWALKRQADVVSIDAVQLLSIVLIKPVPYRD